MNVRFLRVVAGLSVLASGPAGLARAAGSPTQDFFEAEARVVTAAKHPQAQLDSPVTITVITREEIEASGTLHLWDVLRSRAGMDVYDARSLDGNRAVVSIRGFAEYYVDTLQVLIDGRSAFSPIAGGTYWQQLPVQMQDIERIEIVRGPNAALYGSNAATGVINIITKRAPAGGFARADALAGNDDTARGAVAAGIGGERAGVRLSHTQADVKGFPRQSQAQEFDDARSAKTNLRAFWRAGSRLSLEAFAGISRDRLETPVALEDQPVLNDRDHFQMLKGEYTTGPGSAFEFLLARRDAQSFYGPVGDGDYNFIRTYQYDGEAQHRIRWSGGRSHTVYGIGIREAHSQSTDIFPVRPPALSVARAFLSQNGRLTRRLSYAAAFSYEESELGESRRDTALQAALIHQPTHRDAIRASFSQAPSLGSIFFRQGAAQISTDLIVEGNPNLAPSEIRSYELSYQAVRFNHRLLSNISLYYMDVNNLDTAVLTNLTLFPVFSRTISYSNENSAIARGAEAEVKYRFDRGHALFANYTYQSLNDRLGLIYIMRGSPEHKFNVGGRVRVGERIELSASAGYKDGYAVGSPSGLQPPTVVPAYWRIDARAAYSIKNVQFFVAGQNLGREAHTESSGDIAVPRRYQAGIRVSFGRE